MTKRLDERMLYTRDEMAYALRISATDIDKLRNLGVFPVYGHNSTDKYDPIECLRIYKDMNRKVIG